MKTRTCRGCSTSNSTILPIYRRKLRESVQTPITSSTMWRVTSSKTTTIHPSHSNSNTTTQTFSDRLRIPALKTIWMSLKTLSSAMHHRTRLTRKLRNNFPFKLSFQKTFFELKTDRRNRHSPTRNWLSMRWRTRASWQFPAFTSGSRKFDV